MFLYDFFFCAINTNFGGESWNGGDNVFKKCFVTIVYFLPLFCRLRKVQKIFVLFLFLDLCGIHSLSPLRRNAHFHIFEETKFYKVFFSLCCSHMFVFFEFPRWECDNAKTEKENSPQTRRSRECSEEQLFSMMQRVQKKKKNEKKYESRGRKNKNVIFFAICFVAL